MAAIRKLPATSLVETVFALTIIVGSITIGSIVYLNTITGDVLGERAELGRYLAERALEHRHAGILIDQELEWKGYQVKELFQPFDGDEGLVMMQLEARNKKGRLIEAYKEIIPHEKN